MFSAAVAGAEIRFSRSPFPNKRKTMSCFRRLGGPPGAGIASGTLWVGRAAADVARMWVDVGTHIRYAHRPARGTCGLGAPLPTSQGCGSMWVRISTTHIEIDVVTTCGSPNKWGATCRYHIDALRLTTYGENGDNADQKLYMFLRTLKNGRVSFCPGL